MKQISISAANALFADKKFKRDNTEVVSSINIQHLSSLYLFGNRIAFIDVNGLLNITTAGYDTITTRERLNALGVPVTHKNKQLKLFGIDWDGKWVAINNIRVEVRGYETLDSWGHKAKLYVNGGVYAKNKIRYYNRTWEVYRFQSVKQGVIREAIKTAKKDKDKLLVAQLESFYKTL